VVLQASATLSGPGYHLIQPFSCVVLWSTAAIISVALLLALGAVTLGQVVEVHYLCTLAMALTCYFTAPRGNPAWPFHTPCNWRVSGSTAGCFA